MESIYDILFSFRVQHDLYTDLVSRDFQIIPTASCQINLARHGMIFKSDEEGGSAIIEKYTDGVITEPLRKIQDLTAFTFLIKAVNPQIFSQTKPYTETALPAFTGLSRILYLDNLNNANQIDASTTLSNQTNIGLEDLASIIPNSFSFVSDPVNIQQIRVEEIKPLGGIVDTVLISPNQRNTELELAKGAYRLIKLGPLNSSEIIFAEKDILLENFLGLIQIYKDSTVDYTNPIHYTLNFQKN